MSTVESEQRRQRVEDALAELLDADEHGNSQQYIWASDIADTDPELSPAMVGTYLARIADESPLPSGLAVEQYRKRRGGASLWIVRREDR
jgi:hypothetical protein